MTVLALAIGSHDFAATQVSDDVDDIRRRPIPVRGTWEVCRDLLVEVAGGTDVTSVGIASVGPIDMAAGVVAPTEIREWRTGFGLVEAVQKLFPTAAVQLALDGVCAATAERAFGAMRTVPDALSMTVSDRIIGAVSVGGFVVVGRTGNAGQVGHVLVPGFDDVCDCGGRGCLESVASATATLKWARTQGWTGASVDELLETARAGDEIAEAALSRSGTALGRAIASAAALLDVDLVIVGGAMARPGTALWKSLGAAVATHARLSSLTGLRVVPSGLGDMGALAGAGVIALAAQR
ncbi:ROK family protein [Nocardia nepalensis]|uniref:ROK family protein n=1 Tax=Nocardia nepalensis TaxID=3375448 RepID=UPI003B680F83